MIGTLECNLPAFYGNYDRQTDRQTDRPAHREVTLSTVNGRLGQAFMPDNKRFQLNGHQHYSIKDGFVVASSKPVFSTALI